MAPEQFVLCIDLGGTNLRVALLSADGTLLERVQQPTPADAPPQAVVQLLLDLGRQLLARRSLSFADLGGIGVAAPGPLDPEAGIIWDAPNLPTWNNVPLRQWLEQQTGLRVAIGNDANLGALGEHRYGVARGVRHMVYLTLSTGIGGGLILDGRLYLGATGTAGEIGHMVVELDGPPCGCGRRGCLEAIASGTAIARQAREALQTPQGAHSQLANVPLDELEARHVFAAAEQGDALARAILGRSAAALGAGLASLLHLFDPELLVFGGGLTRQPALLLEPALAEMRRRAFPQPAQAVRVERVALGDNSNLYGALALVLDRLVPAPR